MRQLIGVMAFGCRAANGSHVGPFELARVDAAGDEEDDAGEAVLPHAGPSNLVVVAVPVVDGEERQGRRTTIRAEALEIVEPARTVSVPRERNQLPLEGIGRHREVPRPAWADRVGMRARPRPATG